MRLRAIPRPSRALAALLLVALAVLPACASQNKIVLEATFDDVIDLVPRAHVRTADVPIGTISSIELTDDNRARVVMAVRDGTGLPAKVEAVLRQTSLLGERYVELRAIEPGGTLASGAIDQTRVITDFEDLVDTGNELLEFVVADRLSAAVQTSAVAFGGRGGTIGGFIADVETFVGTYDDNSDEVLRLIDALDELTATIAPDAQVHAETLDELARASAALTEEDDRLLDALTDLTRLSDVGTRLMGDHRTLIDASIRRLRVLLDAINGIDGALQGFLTWLPRHNIHVPNGVVLETAQVWNDFRLCNENDGDHPSSSCTPPNPNTTNEGPPGMDDNTACLDHHVDCPGRTGGGP